MNKLRSVIIRKVSAKIRYFSYTRPLANIYKSHLKLKILDIVEKHGLKIGGLFMVIVSLIVINNGFVRKNITEENFVVTAKVIEAPSDCDNLGRRGGTYKLEFNGKVFVKRGNRLICELVFGKEKVEVLTNKEKDKIIFPNEYKNSNDFLYGTLLLLFGIIIAFKGLKK